MSNTKTGHPRATTLPRDRPGRGEVEALRSLPVLDEKRPQTRGECEGVERPCLWVSCKWHLYLDVTKTGNLKLNFPTLEPDELTESCALDLAERGGLPLDVVGDAVNLTRERIRQVQDGILARIAPRARLLKEGA